MPDFHLTPRGRQYYDHDIPQLARSMDIIAQQLIAQNQLKERELVLKEKELALREKEYEQHIPLP